MKHALLLGALVATLLPASAGASHRAPLAATISGTAAPAAGGAADLTLTNTGSTAILFDRGTAPKPLDQASQDGKQCQVDGPQWHCGPFSVPAHGSFHLVLHSPQGLTKADGPFQLFVSDDGKTDSGPFSIPWAADGPGQKCKCAKLTASASGVGSGQLNPAGPTRLTMRITWRLTCTGGVGRCRGKIKVLPPAGSDVQIVQPGQAVTCTSPCGKSSTGTFLLKATSANDLDFDKRANKSFAFVLRRTCGRTPSNERITLAFGPRGYLDRKQSDLNGNGVPDGKEK